tara:strand:+ start:1190 stop:1837 length:648 start_codon:yes stop_codon:yes gene_type:complete
MFGHFRINWSKLSNMHKAVGVAGLALLFVYLVIAFFWGGFRTVLFRGLWLPISFLARISMIFALIPLYLNWLSSDYFQERKGTSYKNAITNGFTGLWVCVEWVRVSIMVYMEQAGFLLLLGKLFMSLLILIYAVIIIKKSWRGERITHIIGRAREISYIAIMITPIMYNVAEFSFVTILAIIMLFPVFYGVVEFIDFTILPPPAYEKKRKSRKLF